MKVARITDTRWLVAREQTSRSGWFISDADCDCDQFPFGYSGLCAGLCA